MRSQIFRQIVQKFCRHTDVCQGTFVRNGEKYASRFRASSVRYCLKTFQLSNNISGGQKQRVAIARAIVNKPSVILADEPTGALDSKTAAEIMELFRELNNNGHTIIIVIHDLEIANQCDRIIEISDGKIVQ